MFSHGWAGGVFATVSRSRSPRATRSSDKGFTLIELLIVVAIIGIIAAIGVSQVLRARLSANETGAIGSMRAINSAQTTYMTSAGAGGFATSLTILGASCPGSAVGFISPDLNPASPGVTLGAGTGVFKSGYDVDLVGNGMVAATDCNGQPTNSDYLATATPITIGATGVRGFNTSGDSTIYFDAAGGAAGTTPLQ
jgi:type IV pilus assembly protein PilA